MKNIDLKGVQYMSNNPYCLNTSTIRNCGLNLQEKIELAAKVGYQGIELWVSEIEEYVKGEGVGILAGLKKLKEIVDKNSIKVPNLIAFPQWANPDKEIRYKALLEAEQVFEIAQMLNCDFVAAPPSGIADMADLPSKDIAEYYKDLMKAVKGTGVTPLLEFWGHAKRLGSLVEAMEIMELVGSSDVLLLCDVFHMAKTEGSFELMKKLKGSQIGLFHVNDYPQADDIRKLTDQQRVYPGDGVAPLSEIFGTLKDIGFKGMYSLELFNREYEKAGAESVVKTGFEKMKKVIV